MKWRLRGRKRRSSVPKTFYPVAFTPLPHHLQHYRPSLHRHPKNRHEIVNIYIYTIICMYAYIIISVLAGRTLDHIYLYILYILMQKPEVVTHLHVVMRKLELTFRSRNKIGIVRKSVYRAYPHITHINRYTASIYMRRLLVDLFSIVIT